jgi:iron only hydrogenase large subunit-like protein
MTSSVKVGSHNDYIAQSQGCVVTLKGLKKQLPTDDSQVRILPKKETAVSTDPVKVSLHDCLACSGCITTAETVMLEQQSTGIGLYLVFK